MGFPDHDTSFFTQWLQLILLITKLSLEHAGSSLLTGKISFFSPANSSLVGILITKGDVTDIFAVRFTACVYFSHIGNKEIM